jgi:dipeptidyl aminopeptidase/acylaminoacyl peptidase
MNSRHWHYAALALSVLLAGCLKMDSFLFSPTKVDHYLDPADMAADWCTRFIIPESLYREVELTSSNGNRIYGFLVQPAGPARDSVTVLYCHGNGHNINRFWSRVELLWEMGYRVFIFDYQGYGRSEGAPTGEACYADGRAALEYVLSRPEVNPNRVVYYGWSMGTFVATYLAADSVLPLAVVLESPPASASALVKEGTAFDVPGSFLTEFDFDNVTRVPRIPYHVLLMHGMKDDYLPYRRHALMIIAAAGGYDNIHAFLVADAGHDDLPTRLGHEYPSMVTEYINGRVNER